MGTASVLLMYDTINYIKKNNPEIEFLEIMDWGEDNIAQCLISTSLLPDYPDLPEQYSYHGQKELSFREDGSIRIKRDVDT